VRSQARVSFPARSQPAHESPRPCPPPPRPLVSRLSCGRAAAASGRVIALAVDLVTSSRWEAFCFFGTACRADRRRASPFRLPERCRRASVSPRQEADRSVGDLHGHRDRVIYGGANRRPREITSHPIINSGYEISYSRRGAINPGYYGRKMTH